MSNSLLREVILDNYHNPQNLGKPGSYTHSHELRNLSCGDEITVYMTIGNNKITAINYEIRACALSIATASILSQELIGTRLDSISGLDQSYLNNLLETTLTISRVKCALLPLRAIQQAAGVLEPEINF